MSERPYFFATHAIHKDTEILALGHNCSGLLGVGIRFLSELERGKPTLEIERPKFLGAAGRQNESKVFSAFSYRSATATLSC